MNRRMVAVVAGGCLVLGANGCQQTAAVPITDPVTTSPGPATDAPPRDRRPRVVTLAFAGDSHFQLNLSSLLQHPDGALGPVARSLADADLTMLNLESAVTDRGSLDPKQLEAPGRRFWYRTSPTALDLLAQAGVDVVTMANNHAADYGPDGFTDTLDARDRGPLPIVGIGRDRADAFTPYRVTVHRTRLALLAADTSRLESREPLWTAGPDSPGVAAARGPHARALLRAVRSSAARDEVVVVYLHWGQDQRSCPSDAQRRLAQRLADAGADVVVGSGAHVPQGAGWLGDTYVSYGVGNFLWYHDHSPDTGVLRLRIMDGTVLSHRWSPARIPPIGPPYPLRGAERIRALGHWQALRSCSGLAASPYAATLPAYESAIDRIGPAQQRRMRSTLPAGCPVSWAGLRLLRVTHVGFDGAAHAGRIVVAAGHARDVARVFARLYEARWPIRRLRPVSRYGGSDARSMAADNTSGFNCRRVAGTSRWSAHAFGTAIDVNPVENPDLHTGVARPAAGRPFAALDRGADATVPAGVIRAGDVVVRAFAAIGWAWGGDWSRPDHQHFEAPR